MSGNHVRVRIPNAPGTGPVLSEDDLQDARAERPPMVTNRHYILDKDRWGHVPMTPGGRPVFGVIEDAALEGDSVVLTLAIGDAKIADLMRGYGDPAPGYAAVMSGSAGLRIAEVGLAPQWTGASDQEGRSMSGGEQWPGTRSEPVDEELLGQLVQATIGAADMAALNRPRATAADQTRAELAAALRCAVRNGLITITRPADWPEWVSQGPEDDPEVTGP
jgi:hypothetical protein